MTQLDCRETLGLEGEQEQESGKRTISLSELGVLDDGTVHEHVLLQGLNQKVPLGAQVSDTLPNIHEITLRHVRQQGIDGDKCARPADASRTVDEERSFVRTVVLVHSGRKGTGQ